MTQRSSSEGITKRFPGTLANDDVDLTVGRGEIHALMGENGAGKSTLMSILYGMERADAGSIRIDGGEVAFGDPSAAMAAGLGMVHQSFEAVRLADGRRERRLRRRAAPLRPGGPVRRPPPGA
ncbi:ATP-binding cassette domain-containing protein [Streptomyces sp. L7]